MKRRKLVQKIFYLESCFLIELKFVGRKIERRQSGDLGELSNLIHIYVYDDLVEAQTWLEMKAQAIYSLNQSTTQNYIRLN